MKVLAGKSSVYVLVSLDVVVSANKSENPISSERPGSCT